MNFSPCNDLCTKEGTHCEGCGRSHEEIARMKQLVGGLVDFAKQQNYENTETFAKAVAKSLVKKLA